MSRDFDNKKPGTGVAFPPRNSNANGPNYKGHIILPNGELIGVAIWEKRGSNGPLLSISIDDREGEYQARKLDLPQMRLGNGDARESGQRRDDGRDNRSYQRERYDQRRERQQDERQASFDDDLDDEVPF